MPALFYDGINGARRGGLLPQAFDRGAIGEVRLDQAVVAALQGMPRRFGCRAVGLVVQRDRDTARGQCLADGCADSARGAGHEYAGHASTRRLNSAIISVSSAYFRRRVR